MDERGERREEKLIGCRQVYGTPAAFSLSHHGRPTTLTHARRGPSKILSKYMIPIYLIKTNYRTK
jgi:hypothetical protein